MPFKNTTYIYTHILYHKNQFTIVLCVNFFFYMKLKNKTEKKHRDGTLFYCLVIQSGVSFG